MRIGISGDGLTLFAKDVPRFEVLEAIAERYDFTIIDWDQRDPVIDAELSAVTLEHALAQMIEPTPYALRYVQDPEIGRALVTELEIGEEDEARRLVKLERAGLQGEPQTKEDEQAARRREIRLRRAYVPPSTEEDRSFRMARREKRQARWREENLAMLEDVDPNARAEAVFNLDATNLQEHDQLEDLLLNDPDPRVRTEAAAMFSFGEAEGAVPSLLRALQDPVPEVVVAAAEALGWTSDPHLASEIEPLLNHPSEKVREQAAETLDFLR